jgi:hypothetical protein
MSGNVKALRVVPLVLLALGAVLAPVASADFEATAPSPGLVISGNDTQKFKVKASSEATIECTTINADNGSLPGTTTTTISFEPTYSSCENFLSQSVDIHENGCDYVLHLANSATEGTVDLECPTATGIQITVGSICSYELDTQTGLGVVQYANRGTSSTKEIEVRPSVTGITSTRPTHDFPFVCPAGSSEGAYTGNFAFTGVSGSGHVGIFVD